MNTRPKTIFCDIDGTLWDHVGAISEQTKVEKHKLLPNTIEAIDKWDRSGYKIILTTGRKESFRKVTEDHLRSLGIIYDQLIMGLGGGDRILINDRKTNSSKNTAYAINLIRNEGLYHYDFTSEYINIPNYELKKQDKKWGYEELIEFNDNYLVKKKFVKNNNILNNTGDIKRRTIFIISGKIKININNDEKILKSHNNVTILPNISFTIEPLEDTEYLETSTNQNLE